MPARAAALFAAVSVLWGVPYFFIAVALDAFSPVTISAARVLIGGLVLVPLVVAGGRFSALRGRWHRVVVLATVEVAIPFVSIAVGELTVSSALAGVLIATEPIFVGLFAVLLLDRSHRLSGHGWAGLAIGLVGVVVLSGVDGTGDGLPLLLVAGASYGLGAVLLARWFADVPPLTVVCAMLLCAAVPLTLLAIIVDGVPTPTLDTTASLVVLGLACTAGGFIAFFALIRAAGPTTAALITYVAPIVATIAGVGLLDEPFTVVAVLGTALILLGAATTATRNNPSTTST
jgi:drug/metabolite transporter (DMT)-like permease